MRLRRWWRLRSAVKRYARSLGPALARDYGASALYSPNQIRATVRRLGLPAECLDVGYAVFLLEAMFDDVANDRRPGRRQALVKLFRRHEPSALSGSRNPARDTVGEIGGGGPAIFSGHSDL